MQTGDMDFDDVVFSDECTVQQVVKLVLIYIHYFDYIFM
jgi:hypothetical protein